MATYRVEFLDQDGNVRATIEIECRDGAEAIKKARAAHVSPLHFGFNVWEGARLVYGHRR